MRNLGSALTPASARQGGESRDRSAPAFSVPRVPDGRQEPGRRARICSTCNNVVQNVMRMMRERLKELRKEEYEWIRMKALDPYSQVVKDFAIQHERLEVRP